MNILKNEKGQALSPETIQMDLNDFKNNNSLDVYWLGGGGAMINDHGTVIMIDPLLEGFDMPLRKVKRSGCAQGRKIFKVCRRFLRMIQIFFQLKWKLMMHGQGM